MPDKFQKHEFRLVSSAEKFLIAYCETFLKNVDKAYRDTIVKDYRTKTEELVCLIKKANDLRAGEPKRIAMQLEANEMLSDIKTMIPVLCRLCMTGTKKEALLMKLVSEMITPLNNWYISDMNRRMTYLDRKLQDANIAGHKAEDDLKKLTDYYNTGHTEDKVKTALIQAQSLCRIKVEECKEIQKELDEAQKVLQKNMGKNITIMNEVLKEIR